MTDSTHHDSGGIITSSDILLHDAETALMYEELRAAIDGGHESMTHADALAEIAAIRAENAALQQGYDAARLEIDAVRSMIKGMSVSVDVSTGDHDAGHRYFGTVTEVMDDLYDKHGVTLLVQDAEPNFALTPPSMLEDAERYRFLRGHCRITSEHWGGRWSIIVDGPAPKSHGSEKDIDEAVDAARKQGANHEQ